MRPSTTAIALTGSSEAERSSEGITPRKPTESWICRSVGTARAGLGLPADQHFFVSDDVRGYFANHKARLIRACNKWHKTYKAWREANPDKAALFDTAAKAPVKKASTHSVKKAVKKADKKAK